jgi:hypothetical protein
LFVNRASSTLATVNKPIEDDHRKPDPSDSTSTTQGVTKSDTRESTADSANLQPSEYDVDDSATKSEVSDSYRAPARSDTGSQSKRFDRHEGLSEKKVTAASPKHQTLGSENGTRHQLTPSQRSPDTNETEKGRKEPDTESRKHCNHSFEKERRDMVKRMDHTAAELKAAQHRNRDLEERNRHLTNQLAAMSHQLQGAETQHQRTLRLLEAKTSTLKGVQAFLTKEDSFSGGDVIAMVDTLNAEILQIAAFIADRLDDTPKDLNAATDEAKAAHNIAVDSLGESMVRILESRSVQPKLDDDTMELQIALQFCLTYSCHSIIESWIPGCWKRGSLLADIHSRIFEKGQSRLNA